MKPQTGIEDFERLDMRVGRVLSAEALIGARKPSIAMRIDFGPDVGVLSSSAQITEHYAPDELVGRLVLGVVNFPPRRVAGFESRALTLGVYASGGGVVLIGADALGGVSPGDPLG